LFFCLSSAKKPIFLVLKAPFGNNAADLENNEALDSSAKYCLLFSAVKTLNHSSSGGLFQSKLQHGQPQANNDRFIYILEQDIRFFEVHIGKTEKQFRL